VIYGINYVVNYSDTGSAPPSLHLLGKYLWTAWFRGVTPAFAGVNVGIDAHGTEVLYAVGAQLLLVAVVALTVWRNPNAWRAWVFWGVAFAANATVVAFGRLGSLGFKQVGSQLRYDTEMTWLLPLALGFAFFVANGRGLRPLRLPPRRVTFLAGAAAACLYLGAAIDTGHDNARDWRFKASSQAKAYAANMRAGGTRNAGATVLDDQTPAYLIAPPHKPWNRLERLVPAITGKVRVVPGGARPLEAHVDGRLTPIALQVVASGPTALTGAGAVSRTGGVLTRKAGRRCLTGPAVIAFTAEPDLRGESLFARVAYDVERRSNRPALLTADSYRGRPEPLRLDRPRGTAYLDLGHLLRVALPAGAEVCLRASEVGWLAP